MNEPRAAQLFGEAGELDAAAELLLRLARRDTARGALRSAEQLLARAAGTGARTAEVTAELVAVLTLIGRADNAIALGGAALDALAGDQHAELCLRLARAAVVAGRWTAAEDYVERSGRPNDPRSLVLRADAAFGAGRADEAAAIAAIAIERADDTGAYTSLCEALGVSARAGVRSDPAAAGAALRRATQVAAAQGLTPWRVEAMAQLAMVEALTADEPALLRHARQLALDAGMLVQLVSIEFVLWEYTFEIEGPRATEAIARRALETVIPLQLPVLRANAEVVLAGCRGAAGDGPGMAELLDAALQRASGHPDVAAYASLAEAIHALIDHDLHRAQHLADAAMSYLLGHQAAPPLHSFGLWALLRTATGDRDDEARQRIRSHPSSVRLANRAALGYADAIAAGRTGRADEAATGFAAADTLLAGQPWWRRVLRLVAPAAVVDGWGDPVPQLRADLAAHEAAGDTRLARTCRDLLRRAGQPTRRGRGRASVPPALRALGVTSREVDVLELVTAGLTNAQIAARLHLSPRTVDTHVSSLLAKTGVAGRAGLGAFRLSQTR